MSAGSAVLVDMPRAAVMPQIDRSLAQVPYAPENCATAARSAVFLKAHLHGYEILGGSMVKIGTGVSC